MNELPGPNDKSYGPPGIHNLMILVRSTGHPVAYRDYRSLNMNPGLASGLVSAMNSFAVETMGAPQGLRRFEVDGYDCVIEHSGPLMAALVMEPALKKKQRQQYQEKIHGLMDSIWGNYHRAIEEDGADVMGEVAEFVDAEMGFDHKAVVAHELELERARQSRESERSEEQRINGILAKIDAIERADVAQAKKTAHEYNQRNGVYSLEAIKAFKEEMLSKYSGN